MIEVTKALNYNQFCSGRVIPCPCAVHMFKTMILLNNFSSETVWPIFTKFHVHPFETGLKVCSNGHAALTVMPMYGKKIIIKNTCFFKTKNCSNMILSLVAMTGLEKCCITSAYLQWLFHSGEQAVARWPLVSHKNELDILFRFSSLEWNVKLSFQEKLRKIHTVLVICFCL